MNRKSLIQWMGIVFLIAFIPFIYFHSFVRHQADPTNDDNPPFVNSESLTHVLLKTFESRGAVPWYFARWGVSMNQSHLLEDYARWHSEQLRIITENKCRLSNETINNPNVVVFRPWESSGLANVMIGVASAFNVALLSGKVFLLNWQGHHFCNAAAHDLFQEPSINNQILHWSYPEFYRLNPELQLCRPNPRERHNDKPPRHFKEQFEITHRKKESAKTFRFLKCDNYFTGLQGWNELRSNQYFTQLIRDNENMNKLQRMMFGDDSFGPISRFLFQPLPVISKKVADFLMQNEIIVPEIFKGEFIRDASYVGKYKLVGIQIRRNEKERSIKWFTEKEEPFFWKCARDAAKDWTEPYKILIMSDNATTIENTKAHFPDRTIAYPQARTFSRSKEAIQDAWIDLLLLSYSHVQVVSRMSTFGNVGHGRASQKPWVIQRNGPVGKCECYKEESSEPDFHWYEWSKAHKCK